MEFYEYVGEKIRHNRKLAGISQGELAELLGTNQPTVATMERGKRKPSLEDLVKLCKIFNIAAEELLPTDKNKEENKCQN